MKKSIIIAACAAVCLLSACGRSGENKNPGENITSEESAEVAENTEKLSTEVQKTEKQEAEGQKAGKQEVEGQEVEPSWKKVEALNLDIKPVKAFAEDWMALCAGSQKNMNAMTISWGTIGQLWNKNVVTVFVSSDRYTKRLMDSSKYFTVVGFPDTKECREALVYLGSHSRKDVKNKVEESKLSVEFTELGNPVFSEGNLAIECMKIYEAPFEFESIPSDVRNRMYSGEHAIGIHTMYIGEIVNIWQK